MNNDQDELTDGNIKNLERSALLNLDLKIMLDSAETIWEGRAFQGFITLQEKNDFWKLVLTRGRVSLISKCFNEMFGY